MKFDGDETGPHLGKKERIENVVFYMQVAMQQEKFIRASYSRSSIRYGSGTGNGARFYYRKRNVLGL